MLKNSILAASVFSLVMSFAHASITEHRPEQPERPGDRRGGRHLFLDQNDHAFRAVLAREASEGRRGGDHERAGDRQRRGGRHLFLDNNHEFGAVLAREASEGKRGGDHERAGDRQRRGGRIDS